MSIFAKVKTIWESKFFRNVVVVAGGSAGAQIILIAFTPLITRLYGPEAFGYQGTFIAFATALTPLAAMAYPIAIVLPKEDADALSLARLSFFFSLCIAIVVSIGLFIGGNWIIELLNLQGMTDFLWLIPIYMFFSGCFQIVNQWRIRKKQFKAAARISIIHALLINSFKVGAGLVAPVASTLIMLATFGMGLQPALLLAGMKDGKLLKSVVAFERNGASLLDVAKRYIEFPKFRASQDFLNAIAQGLPVIMLAALFTPAAAGFFTLAKSVLLMPTHLLAKAVGDVFYPKISEAYNNHVPIAPLIVKATATLAAVGFIPFATITIAGPYLFDLVFGEQWTAAGKYAQWLSIWLFFLFINRPANISLPVMGLLKTSLVFEIVGTLSRIAAIYAGFIIMKDDVAAIALFCLCGVVLNCWLIGFALISARRRDKQKKPEHVDA